MAEKAEILMVVMTLMFSNAGDGEIRDIMPKMSMVPMAVCLSEKKARHMTKPNTMELVLVACDPKK